MNKTPVLIVGAGPSGLMMACELARHGVPFRIIDKKSERTATSNAVWLQTRTLEILTDIGIVHPFLQNGRICKAINVYDKKRLISKISLNYLDSIYHYVLMLPQSETERILNTVLESSKCFVERPLELIDIKQVDGGIDTVVLNGEGKTEVISCDWLIATDGYDSTIRKICKLKFPGDDMQEQFMVADAQMATYSATDELHVFLDKGTVLSAFPLGQGKYRVSANLNVDMPRQYFTEREVKELVTERASGEFAAESVSWISPYWIHSRCVEQMQHGSIFLVGDAAHVHSPALGQGMNAGMQDAYNLAWKLALVIHGKAKTTLLDSYHQERHPVVKAIMQRSDEFTKKMMYQTSFKTRTRNVVLRLMHGVPYLAKQSSMHLTQLDLRYENSPVINYKESPSAQRILPGMRAPDVIIDSSKRLHQCLHATKHNILLFIGKKPTSDDIFNLREIQNSLDMMFSDTVKTHVVTQHPEQKFKTAIYDKNALIHKAYRAKRVSVFILRPDNCIAYYSEKPSEYAIKHFLDRYLYS